MPQLSSKSTWLAALCTLSIVSALTPAQSARADLYLEPYAGYGTGSNDFSMPSPTVTSDTSGVGLGGRAGIEFLDMLFVAADFNWTPSLTSSNGGASSKASRTELGLDVGYSVPLMPVRGWVGYNFVDRLSSKDIDSVLTGNALKFGVGFKFIPMLSLNVEYIMHSYNHLKATGIDADIASPSKVTGHTWFLSVSFPLSI